MSFNLICLIWPFDPRNIIHSAAPTDYGTRYSYFIIENLSNIVCYSVPMYFKNRYFSNKVTFYGIFRFCRYSFKFKLIYYKSNIFLYYIVYYSVPIYFKNLNFSNKVTYYGTFQFCRYSFKFQLIYYKSNILLKVRRKENWTPGTIYH